MNKTFHIRCTLVAVLLLSAYALLRNPDRTAPVAKYSGDWREQSSLTPPDSLSGEYVGTDARTSSSSTGLTVVDTSGAPIENARVSFFSVENEEISAFLSDETGRIHSQEGFARGLAKAKGFLPFHFNATPPNGLIQLVRPGRVQISGAEIPDWQHPVFGIVPVNVNAPEPASWESWEEQSLALNALTEIARVDIRTIFDSATGNEWISPEFLGAFLGVVSSRVSSDKWIFDGLPPGRYIVGTFARWIRFDNNYLREVVVEESRTVTIKASSARTALWGSVPGNPDGMAYVTLFEDRFDQVSPAQGEYVIVGSKKVGPDDSYTFEFVDPDPAPLRVCVFRFEGDRAYVSFSEKIELLHGEQNEVAFAGASGQWVLPITFELSDPGKRAEQETVRLLLVSLRSRTLAEDWASSGAPYRAIVTDASFPVERLLGISEIHGIWPGGWSLRIYPEQNGKTEYDSPLVIGKLRVPDHAGRTISLDW